MLDALNYALGKGVFVAIAAGNGKETGNLPSYPAVYAEQLSGVMAVAATGRSGNHAFYSNTGSYVEIAAPGGDSRDSDTAGSGFIWQSTILPSVSDQSRVLFPVFNQYGEVAIIGTSQATPHVSGLAALLFSQGFKTPAQIEQAIRKTAKLVGAPGSAGSARNDEVGFGLIQPRAALFGSGIKK
jgi:serine protease